MVLRITANPGWIVVLFAIRLVALTVRLAVGVYVARKSVIPPAYAVRRGKLVMWWWVILIVVEI
jgi:hypothetical protein